jgi:hypothetical protein
MKIARRWKGGASRTTLASARTRHARCTVLVPWATSLVRNLPAVRRIPGGGRRVADVRCRL